MSRKQEEDLMALYAIAREEIDGVQDACAKLKKTVSHLNEISGDIHYRASTGIQSALKDFKEQNNEALRQTLYKATEGLEQTCYYAKNRLSNRGKPNSRVTSRHFDNGKHCKQSFRLLKQSDIVFHTFFATVSGLFWLLLRSNRKTSVLRQLRSNGGW